MAILIYRLLKTSATTQFKVPSASCFSTFFHKFPQIYRVPAFRQGKLIELLAKLKFKPECSGNIYRTLRLSGLSLSLSLLPAVKQARCSRTLSKRVDHLRDSGGSEEPQLRWGDLIALILPHFVWLCAAVVAAFLTALLNIRIPIYLGELINGIADIVRNTDVGLGNLSPIAYKLLLAYAAQAGLTALYITFLTYLGERMAGDLRMKLFDRLLFLDMSFYDAQKTGELNSRLNVDVQEFKSAFKLTIAQGLRTLAQVIGCMWSLCRISPQMTLVTAVTLPLVIGVGAFCGMLLRSLSRKAQVQAAVATAVADEAFANIRTVRAFAMEPQESSLFKREVERGTSQQELLGMGIGLFQGGTNVLLNGIVLSVLYGGCGLIAKGELSPGDLMAFLVTAQTIQKSLAQLSIVFGSALKGYTAAGRVFQFANIPITMNSSEGICIPYHSMAGQIQFQKVSFNYPGRPDHTVLDSLDLVIPAGQVTALCGPSGEGKSTIVNLVERFYDPLEGKIFIDGKDLKGLNLEWLRKQVIGLISQEPVLFATSIKENIRYGRPGASDQEVEEAAKMANADAFIRSFPSGYDTVVGERGAQLSGGQRQRIAIARALLKDPPILILDEATSALDSESERMVKQALDRAIKGRTVLVVAHRLSTIQNAHKIVVIQKGQVAEEGTHEELMKKKGVYATLVSGQKME